MQLPLRSLDRLKGVHPDLIAVVLRAAELHQDNITKFIVTEGVRTLERQRELFLAHKSQTMNSRHLIGKDFLGHAVDLAIWEDRDEDKVVDADELSWKFPAYKDLADKMKEAAKELGIPIKWGGDWTTLKDGPHFELDRTVYP